MEKYNCLLPGKELSDLKEDFRAARRLEQYRLGEKALYLPRGLRWDYLPLGEIRSAGRTRRVISAGHCVTVREEKPAVDLETGGGTFTLNLEKNASAEALLQMLAREEGKESENG